MPLELERKFCIKKELLPPLEKGEHYIQGYLQNDPQVRFRIIDRKAIVIGIKKDLGAGKRFEFELSEKKSTQQDMDMLRAISIYPPVVKRRYKIPFKKLIWEIDVYEGSNAGLIVAEVELHDLKQEIIFPDWVDQQKELTGERRYGNIGLAQRPYCEWRNDETI